MEKKDRGIEGVNARRRSWKPGYGRCQCGVCKSAKRAFERSGNEPALGTTVSGCEYVNPEAVFAATWNEEQRADPCRDHGLPRLQELMIIPGVPRKNEPSVPSLLPGAMPRYRRVAFKITERDQTIVATVMQWLGSAIGQAFLKKALGRCGFAVISREELAALRAKEARLNRLERELDERVA